MKKHEAIKKVEQMGEYERFVNELIPKLSVLNILNQYKQGYEQGKVEQELNKPVIPQFVADWIEYCKIKKISLAHALYRSDEAENKSVYRWIVECLENQETFARAWLDGYDVEKEKRYYVRFKGMESNDFNYLNFIKFQHAWVLSSIKLDKKFRTEHTKKQLEEANFGWVFDCEGIEIEEVEE